MIQKHRPQKKNLAFFWHPLDEPPGDEYDVIFRQALAHLRERFAQRSVKETSGTGSR